MVRAIIVLGLIGAAVYYLTRRVRVTGSVTALYSEAKVSSPPKVSPGDSAENALIGPATYNY